MACTQIIALVLVIFSMVDSNPVPQNTYEVYARLVCEANRLWTNEWQLFTDFKDDRMPGAPAEISPVSVPNLLLTNDMTLSMRYQSSEIDLLDDHRDYLYDYKYIIDYLLADELNATSQTNFKTDIENIRRFTSFTIAELEDTMIHLGHSAKAASIGSESERPYFDPEWEKDTFSRHHRDLYVLNEMKDQLQKVVQDFSSWRDRYIDHNTIPYECAI